MMKMSPVVFAVHDTYHIMVMVATESLMWVRVGKKHYYDQSNGVLRSACGVHRMIVPASELDEEQCYTICEREIINRKAYYTETKEVKETFFSFTPVSGDTVRCFHISDAHNKVAEPVCAAHNYGKIDFLIMNGDIPEDSSKLENFDTIYEIGSQITKGQIPVIFARGNHELRGVFAEKIVEYCPNENGKSYYTFRVGKIWGVVLDCGEDKADTSSPYGNTICCHDFRERQTRFIRQVIDEKEYEEEGIEYRIVVVHNPFTRQIGECFEHGECFNIEEDIYREWGKLLKAGIRPDVMFCGHLHTMELHMPGCEKDHLGQPCPVVIGATLSENYYAGTGITFDKQGIHTTFVDSDGKMWGQQTLTIPNIHSCYW